MTKEQLNKFRPTEAMKTAARTVFMAMAYTQSIKPVVESYQKEIINFYQFEVSPEWIEKGKPKGKITKSSEMYLATEKDFQLYLKESVIAREKAGLKVEDPEHCPLLVAQNIQRIAENILMDTMEALTGINSEKVNFKLDLRKNYLDLCLTLLVPFLN